MEKLGTCRKFAGYPKDNGTKFLREFESFCKLHELDILNEKTEVQSILCPSLYNSIPQACKSMIDVNNGDNIKLANDQNVQVKGKIIAKFSQLTEEYQVRHVNCTNNVPVVQNINLVKQCPAEQGDSIDCEFLENFEINPTLKDDQKIALNHLLCDNKEVFVTTDRPNLGCTDIAQHHIILKPDMRPLHQKPYRLTPHKKEVLRHHLDELLQQGVICELNATEEVPITSPVVLVAKRSKPSSEQISEKTTSLRQFRFCVDFRYLNTQTEPLKSFIPDIQELTESFTERIPNYIASIDMSSGFFK
ncbi:unnamed protein product [Mytilus coruscus]|uniref:Integrase catalytic domain-containing protein n=1 Tax=Mytilus coruscus TaxID=42192 RepID=A0A6J8D9I5_MYTCO|nr:unnamed protein product [Mytilus coruscus]